MLIPSSHTDYIILCPCDPPYRPPLYHHHHLHSSLLPQTLAAMQPLRPLLCFLLCVGGSCACLNMHAEPFWYSCVEERASSCLMIAVQLWGRGPFSACTCGEGGKKKGFHPLRCWLHSEPFVLTLFEVNHLINFQVLLAHMYVLLLLCSSCGSLLQRLCFFSAALTSDITGHKSLIRYLYDRTIMFRYFMVRLLPGLLLLFLCYQIYIACAPST